MRGDAEQALAEFGLADILFDDEGQLSSQTDAQNEADHSSLGSLARWRNKDRIKTQAAALILCLNIGVDPPDVIKVSPCARMECWMQPDPVQSGKNSTGIAKALQQQYERWQPRARYKTQADPTVDEVKKLCKEARRAARNERVLFHYNGHGVPQPTANGEIWVFNRHFTQYIPVSIHDLSNWLGKPAIYVLDCSHAGLILDSLLRAGPSGESTVHAGSDGTHCAMPQESSSSQEIIVLAACGSDQQLPQDSDLCADIFTACLTTPIRVAMRWCLSRTALTRNTVGWERVDRIPGKHTDRKTLLGELHWIFTSITDTIAWNMLPRSVFQKLFRQDLLLASLFRNFMLAERILKACGCQPVSSPRLPPMHQHPLWDAWDVTAEQALLQLPAVISDEMRFVQSSFFKEQLTAFEYWLNHSGASPASPPQQLPIVLQVLLSQVHRVRALSLLGQFLDMGAWCVELALSVGIFPYVLKLLQTTLPGLRASLVFIWCKILAADRNCQADIVTHNGHPYFVAVLREQADGLDAVSLATQAQAVFVLTMICDSYPLGQQRCLEAGVLHLLLRHMEEQKAIIASFMHGQGGARVHGGVTEHLLLLKWTLLALGKLFDQQPNIVHMAHEQGDAIRKLKESYQTSFNAEVRAAAIFALGCCLNSSVVPSDSNDVTERTRELFRLEQDVLMLIHQAVRDGSMLVRVECSIAIGRAAVVPPSSTGSSEERELCHHDQFLKAFQNQRARVLLDMNHQRMSMMMMAPVLHHSETGAATPDTGSRRGLRGTHSDGHVSHERWISGDMNLRSGVARSETDMLSTRKHLCGADSAVLEEETGRDLESDRAITAVMEAEDRNADATPAEAEEEPQAPADESATNAVNETDTTPPAAPETPDSATSDKGNPNNANSVAARDSPTPAEPGPGTRDSSVSPTYGDHQDASFFDDGNTPLTQAGTTIYDSIAEAVELLATDPAPAVAYFTKVSISQSGHELDVLVEPEPSLSSQNRSSIIGGAYRGSAGSVSSSQDPGGATRRDHWSWFNLRKVTGAIHGLSHPGHRDRGTGSQLHAPPLSPCSTSPTAAVHQVQVPTHGRTCIISRHAGNQHTLMGGPSASTNGHPASTSYGGASRLPVSLVYKRLIQRFQRPMKVADERAAMLALRPMNQEWGVIDKIESRIEQQNRAVSSIENCIVESSTLHKPRMQEGVVTMKTSQKGTSALVFHPQDGITAVDPLGVVRVMECGPDRDPHNYHMNCFHVFTGQNLDARSSSAPSVAGCSIVDAYMLNGLDRPLFMACAADGAVYVWEKHMIQGAQNLVAAWQTVDITQQFRLRPLEAAAYHYLPGQNYLCSVRGGDSSEVAVWDLREEREVMRVSVEACRDENRDGSPCRQLLTGTEVPSDRCPQPLLLCSSSNGVVSMFDLRDHSRKPNLALRCHDQGLTGMAIRPSGILATATTTPTASDLHFSEIRMGSGARDSTRHLFRREEAHKTGKLTTLCAHRHAPIFATGSDTQVVKVWTERGEMSSSIRAKQQAPVRMGKITCMAFAPFVPRLATGASDSCCTLYSMAAGDERVSRVSSRAGDAAGHHL